MEATVFSTMMANIGSITSKCQKIKEVALGGSQVLKTMKVEDYNKIISSAQQLQSQMDKIMQNEVYHILGMGNLSVSQTSAFVSAIKKLSKYRTSVKLVATLTKLPTGKELVIGDSTYKSALAGTVLKVSAQKKGVK